MEKTTKPLDRETTAKQSSSDVSKNKVWDCGSSLYDSFELKSFQRQLDSAIISSSRTMSMPHLSDRRLPPPPAAQPRSAVYKKPASKFSRSLQRLIRSVFRPKNSNHWRYNEGFYAVYDTSGALSTIPEAPEFGGMSPEMRSQVRRTASDRFTPAASVGIYCA